MAEINRKDRQNNHPWRNVLAEKIEPDHLARTRIEHRTHKHGFADRQTVIERYSTEQQAKRGACGNNGNTSFDADPKIVAC